MSLLSRLAVQAARAYGMLSSKSTNVSASYLVVAGGAGGNGAGGGAGGLLTNSITLSLLTTYTITVGAGGALGTGTGQKGFNGADSSLSGTGITTQTASGGGGGGSAGSSGFNAGANGGSGGGGGNFTAVNGPGGTGTSGQGNNGGSGTYTPQYGCGGGGGSSSAGGNGTGTNGGNGGAGTASSISGSSVYYAGGGGGGVQSGTAGTGGNGGGGNGNTGSTAGSNATANTGGGGGGGAILTSSTGGNGGSGVVIISYASATPKFIGGTLTTSGGNQIHTFTSSGTLSPLTPVTASYLVVAGGGGGGSGCANTSGGGGGAGGLQTSSTTLYSGATYIVTVGAGGAGAATGATSTKGASGQNSVLSGTGLTTITSTGGGGGGSDSTGQLSGANGGSGGGGARVGGAGGTGTSGQGNNGGAGIDGSYYGSGGGGGSGAAGTSASGSVSGSGGAGTASSISGSSVTYAMGAAGCGNPYGATNGTNPTNAGSPNASGAGGSATANYGGGGGAGYNGGGNGGSGVVIISYAGSQVFNGGLVTSSGGNTIHTFNATGALTPLTNNLNNSLRLRRSNNAYLSRTPTVAGNRKTWTWSAWVKRGALGIDGTLITSRQNGQADWLSTAFTSSDTLQVCRSIGGTYNLVTTQVFRDPSAWYHIVIAWDTTQATAANRVKLYINGNQVTAFGTANYPTLNYDGVFNTAVEHEMGAVWATSSVTDYFDGYMTDINFIDGQALEPYYFGNNDANGVWKPIKYTGMYGTNGFYLTFGNTTSTTTLGYDSSGNGNNWTTNNISLTAGTTYDAMLDVPTNTSATVANYCTLNPIWLLSGSAPSITNGNLQVTSTSTSDSTIGSTMGMTGSGKYYAEFTAGTNSIYGDVGIINITHPASTAIGNTATSYNYRSNGNKVNNSTQTSYGATYTTNDVIGIALDLDSGTITFYKNNVSQGTAFTGISASNVYTFACGDELSSGSFIWTANFGQRPFAYTPPTGYVALNTFNLPTPTILQGNKYMDATTYSGNSSSQSIVNAGAFKPDMIWFKNRNNTENHAVFDTLRPLTTALRTNSTIAEYTNTDTDDFVSYNNNGFSLNGNGGTLNFSTYTYVAWQWQAGQGSTSTNTSGSITSTVSVNATAGFSIATFAFPSSGTSSTIGHGLGVAPKMVIIKSRSSGTASWVVYHASITNANYLLLNSGNALNTSVAVWNNTSPDNSVVTLGSTFVTANYGANGVMYAWAEIAGFSKFGSYTGNGSADGPFVYTGFRPKFIMVKKTDSSSDWWIWDTSRNTYNQMQSILYGNISNAEVTNAVFNFDALSNGFKNRSTDVTVNGNGGTYIYMAFAENPFKNALAR
jgi:hypothetical protein